MNTSNVTANSLVGAPPSAVTTVNMLKTSQQQQPPPSQQQPTTQLLQPSNIIPIITTNERLTNSNNNQPATNNNSSCISQQNHETTVVSQSVTAFTIHAPSQSLQTIPNNLVNAAAAAVGSAAVAPGSTPGQAAQIQAVNANSSTATAAIIHPATIGISGGTSVAPSSVVCTATILPTSQQVTAIPVGVSGPTVLKPSMGTLPIATQRFVNQTQNVMAPAPGPPPNGPINALFIHSDPAASSKNQNVAQSLSSTPSNHHHQPTHIPHNSTTVINSNVSVAGPTTVTLQPISSTQHTTAPQTPLFVQTGHNSSPQQQPTNLSTINLSTSSVQQQPQQSQPQQQQQQQQQQQFQRLKVEDALSYLDQVKFKFNDKPQVYNDFLDIMKEFKSQSIDTPGVIQRVSNLFKGHPELIVGFNTFLPPGYKIEIHANDQVNVSMPNSTNVVLVSNTPIPPHQPPPPSQQQQSSSAAAVATPAIVTSQNLHHHHYHPSPIPPSLARNTLITNQNIHHPQQSQNHHGGQSFVNSIPTRDNISSLSSTLSLSSNNSTSSIGPSSRNETSSTHNHRSSGHSPLATTSSASTNSRNSTIHHLSNQQNSIVPPSGPVEFNHAINYVNKIKNRFLDQPEVYKQFLDILQSYQKEQDNTGQKILTESEVFSKVSKLFENQPDLLQEFSQFLPDAHNSSSHAHHNSSVPSSPHVSSNAVNSSSPANYAGIQSSNQASAMNYSHHHHHHHHPTNMDSPHYAQTSNPVSNNTEHSSGPAKKSINVMNSNSVLSNRTSSTNSTTNSYPNTFHRQPKRSISNSQIDSPNSQHPTPKRPKLRESSIPEAGKYIGDLVDYAFFDKFRVANSPFYYEEFLKCLTVFNDEVFSRSELVQMIHPLFSSCPDLYKRFKEMLNVKESGLVNSVNSNHNLYLNLYNNSYMNSHSNTSYHCNSYSSSSIGHLEGLSNRILRDRRENEFVEDFTSTKKFGASYRTIPKTAGKQECSGRTPLCREVLNDTLVSFPSWSEDSTFVSSRKTQYEEYVYRCEDERYELDLVIETNLATIKVLSSVQRKLERMTPEEKSNFKLDDRLGGSSYVIHVNSIRRIYGENYTSVIEGIKNSPANVIPLVVRRMILKDLEWRTAQRQFNRTWREQNEKYYLKSLDHQGISFKQNDIKFLRSKSLLNEIESIAEERNEQKSQEDEQSQSSPLNNNNSTESTIKNQEQDQPHMIFIYPDKSMIDVACNLIIHHVKRQTSIHKEDKRKIKQLMRHFIPDLFATPRGELSDDETEEEIKTEKKSLEDVSFEKDESFKNLDTEFKPSVMMNSNPDEEYCLFFVNNHWYLFFRLHYILCERLSKMHKRAQQIAAEERENKNSRHSPATLLRLRNILDIKVEDYFATLVDMVKQVLDGNLDSTQFEDNLREMFSIHAYIAFTLDKVVQNIVRHLQHIVGDEVSQQCTELYLEAVKAGAAGGFCNTSAQRAEEEYLYQKNFEQLITDENRFKIIIYKGEGKITIHLLESNDEDEESTNDGDDDSNVPQVSRTLRSTTKNMSEKERQRCLIDPQRLNELLEERLSTNPPFLKKYIPKHKGSSTQSLSSSNDNNNNNNSSNDLHDQSPNSNSNQNEDSNSDKEQPISTRSGNNNNDNKPTIIDRIDDDEEKPKINKNKNNNNNNENIENNECQFKLRHFKSIVVVQSEGIFYRKKFSDKPKSHKYVCQAKYKKFNDWYSKWIESNVDAEVKSKYENWLLKSETTGYRLVDDDDYDYDDDNDNNNGTNTAAKSNNNNNNEIMEVDEETEKSSNDIIIKSEDSSPPSNDNNNKNDQKENSDSNASKNESNKKNNNNNDDNDETIKKENNNNDDDDNNNEADLKRKSLTTEAPKRILQRIRMNSDSVTPYRVYYRYVFDGNKTNNNNNNKSNNNNNNNEQQHPNR